MTRDSLYDHIFPAPHAGCELDALPGSPFYKSICSTIFEHPLTVWRGLSADDKVEGTILRHEASPASPFASQATGKGSSDNPSETDLSGSTRPRLIHISV